MNSNTFQKLLDLNHQFYQSLAPQFSATRQRLQPGVQRFLQRIPAEAQLLDLGCGNGELARELGHRGHRGLYLGLDVSPRFLEEARQKVGQPGVFPWFFIQADLASDDWEDVLDSLPIPSSAQRPFDLILAFAVLHHLPGDPLRRQVLEKAASLLAPGGSFALSVWQFLNSTRLRARLQPWQAIGLDDKDVDPGDYLLDWRHGGSGLRYVHHFSAEELTALAAATGFTVIETFASDGEGGNLGLYQVWQKRV